MSRRSGEFTATATANQTGSNSTSGWTTVSKKQPKKSYPKSHPNGSSSPYNGQKNQKNHHQNINPRDKNDSAKHSATKGKGNVPNIDFIVKTITQSALGNFLRENAMLPQFDNLNDMIRAIFTDVKTPPANRHVSPTELAFRQGLVFDKLEPTISATLLNALLPEIMHFGVLHQQFNILQYAKTVLKPLHDIVGRAKAANRFEAMNQIFWDKRLGTKISNGVTANDEEGQLYIQKQIEIIRAMKEIGATSEGLNKNGEDWLISFVKGVAAGRALQSSTIIAELQKDLDTRTLVRELNNKITPTMSDHLIRKFKYAMHMDCDELAKGLLNNLLGTYAYGKTRGVCERVVAHIKMVLEFLKVKEGEFADDKDGLSLLLANIYTYDQTTKQRFLESLVHQSMIVLTEKTKVKQSSQSASMSANQSNEFVETVKSIMESQQALDVIGSIIGETAVILENPVIFHEFFNSQAQMMLTGSATGSATEKENGEKQILSLIVHTVRCLHEKGVHNDEKNATLALYLNTEIFQNLLQLKLGTRTCMIIEDRITEYLLGHLGKQVITLEKINAMLHPEGIKEDPENSEEDDDAPTDSLEVLDEFDEFDEIAEIDEDGNDIAAKERVDTVIDCTYATDGRFNLIGEAKEMVDESEYPVFQGWRDACRTMYYGIKGKWPSIKSADDDQLYQMIGSIANRVASELHPSSDKADMRLFQITALIKVLQTFVDRSKIQLALQRFSDDLSLLSEETCEILWDNARGQDNFTDFCRALEVNSPFQ